MEEVMKPLDVARYLSLHVRTIYRLARSGKLPGWKIGGSWRFKKETLDKWLLRKPLR